MDTEKVIALDSEYLMQTYGRLPLVPKSGSGAVMTTSDGGEYIDFTSGIGVNSLGYCDPEWSAAVAKQAAEIQHFSNYFYCEGASVLAEKLVSLSGLSRVFFGNSGAEANEGAIKLARKYSFDKYGDGRHVIVTLKKSFHGRTVTTLAATGQDSFHTYFFPFTEGFRYVEAGDIDALKSSFGEGDVCAVMFELIQGEGGVNILDTDYVKSVEKLCRENDILIINDEVQTGVGRTGKMFAFQNYGITPDIVTLAKGLGGGLPIGAFIAGEKVANTLTAGMHGSTFGANPVVCAGANVVLDRVNGAEFLSEVAAKGKYIKDAVRSFNSPHVKDVRGMGLMTGIAVDGSPKDYLKAALHEGLLVLTAGSDVIRLLPPLTITRDEIDRGLKVLEKILK